LTTIREVAQMNALFKEQVVNLVPLTEDLLYHLELHDDSDSEGEDSDDEDEAIAEQKQLRRKFRNRKPGILKVGA